MSISQLDIVYNTLSISPSKSRDAHVVIIGGTGFARRAAGVRVFVLRRHRMLVVPKVPRKLQSDEGIHAIFLTAQVLYPTTPGNHTKRRVGQLPQLIDSE
ncbi:uncharacterized protein C8Q71DRAFT_854888 [Rhodofomes roseus]|uniref:IPT/TIG domain-containing protein n=1 Tax=Rhodofomes roseus TaxID=34475 RepID=A0ABQ8KQW9_9APHY|nr:uncharacterized protein C8Q71DRAFT_854888 [Rhodofomes roseus]KAH9841028.1 hypothetical protein C8Q71DRAFT_854888 [Rhodofomes roseus]